MKISILAVSAALVACGGQPPPAATSAGETDVAPASLDPLATERSLPLPVVRLLKSGSEPRRVLRFSYRSGARGEAALRLAMQTEVVIGQVPLRVVFPETTSRAALEVTHSGTDRFRVRYEILEYKVKEGDSDADLVARLRRELSALVGIEGAAVISDRGFVLSSQFQHPDSSAGDTVEGARMLRDALTKLAIPLPEAPVGVGAMWTVSESVPADGFERDIAARYEVLAIEGEVITVRETVVENGIPSAPRSRAGAEVTLESLEGRVSGERSFSLVNPTPREVSLRGEISSRGRVDAGGNGQVIRTRLRYELALERPIAKRML